MKIINALDADDFRKKIDGIPAFLPTEDMLNRLPSSPCVTFAEVKAMVKSMCLCCEKYKCMHQKSCMKCPGLAFRKEHLTPLERARYPRKKPKEKKHGTA